MSRQYDLKFFGEHLLPKKIHEMNLRRYADIRFRLFNNQQFTLFHAVYAPEQKKQKMLSASHACRIILLSSVANPKIGN